MKDKEYNVVDSLSRKFHIATMSTCKTNLSTRVLEDLVNNVFYLWEKGEFHKEKVNNNY